MARRHAETLANERNEDYDNLPDARQLKMRAQAHEQDLGDAVG